MSRVIHGQSEYCEPSPSAIGKQRADILTLELLVKPRPEECNRRSDSMKDRYWTELVGGPRHGQCGLVLGPETAATTTPRSSVRRMFQSVCRIWRRNRRGKTVRRPGLVAQQHEDADEFGGLALQTEAVAS